VPIQLRKSGSLQHKLNPKPLAELD